MEHIIGNFALQLVLGTGIENGIGVWYMVFLYFSSALGGNLFSGIANPKAVGVGASTSVFGLVGFYLAYLLTNFSYMGRKRYGQRWCLLFFVVILVLVNLLIGSHSDNHIDNYAHLGGFITGAFAGLAITDFFDC